MTEKRFKLRYNESWVDSEYDNLIEDDNKIYTCKEVVDLLNDLSEENEKLKQQLFKVQKWLKILHDDHYLSLATIDGVLTEIDKAVNGDK